MAFGELFPGEDGEATEHLLVTTSPGRHTSLRHMPSVGVSAHLGNLGLRGDTESNT